MQDFVASHRDSVTVPTNLGPSEVGMRVFVQCMELKKKGPVQVGERQCDELLTVRTPPLRIPSQPVKPVFAGG